MRPTPPPDYLAGYPPALRQQVQDLIEQGRLADLLRRRYPRPHAVRSDAALYGYAQELKAAHLRNAPPLGKVCFDSRIHVIRNALGTHTAISRVQGAKLQAKREIRIASVFRDVPPEFLRMIVVHELAHLRERDHDKAFYQLCLHMEPHYHQYEFDLRAYLTWRDATGQGLWPVSAEPAPRGDA
ncbi:YgjP-like metallopeptidase domain-containing protein [Thauera sinica]|uniref:YgjP-like metallopeptidase domain-containing protein n=1 Tax=Thauera sinica TaxID=2665146 RepID=A0ABW1AXN5_9RHOO|nr:YgjP-like metallopeptidase domain-containing protein [Thauera sp. K11]ATE58641.1 metal-dependent hydrolase [Thauera sp. K11]